MRLVNLEALWEKALETLESWADGFAAWLPHLAVALADRQLFLGLLELFAQVLRVVRIEELLDRVLRALLERALSLADPSYFPASSRG